MDKKVQYHTAQRTAVQDYLTKVQGNHVTAAEVCAALHEQGLNIGTATVYRQLERMVAEGLCNKYVLEGSAAACFEYIGGGEECGNTACYHCKCEDCGKLIHLHCEEILEMQEHFAREHGFHWDAPRTVFYGVCDDCLKKRETEE